MNICINRKYPTLQKCILPAFVPKEIMKTMTPRMTIVVIVTTLKTDDQLPLLVQPSNINICSGDRATLELLGGLS